MSSVAILLDALRLKNDYGVSKKANILGNCTILFSENANNFDGLAALFLCNHELSM